MVNKDTSDLIVVKIIFSPILRFAQDDSQKSLLFRPAHRVMRIFDVERIDGKLKGMKSIYHHR
jgi:hypothetical protein